jgi:hypothetical protein
MTNSGVMLSLARIGARLVMSGGKRRPADPDPK